jgi:hypothetical protein
MISNDWQRRHEYQLYQWHGRSLNEAISLSRLLLAAERHRRAHGQYPHSLGDLDARFLPAEPLAAPGTRLDIGWCDAFQLRKPIWETPDRDGLSEELDSAVGRYWQRHRHEPRSVGELRSDFPDPARYERIAAMFRSFPARPVFCLWRTDAPALDSITSSYTDAPRIVFPLAMKLPRWITEPLR